MTPSPRKRTTVLKPWQWGGLGLKTDQNTREQQEQHQPQLLQAYSEHYVE